MSYQEQHSQDYQRGYANGRKEALDMAAKPKKNKSRLKKREPDKPGYWAWVEVGTIYYCGGVGLLSGSMQYTALCGGGYCMEGEGTRWAYLGAKDSHEV